MPSARAGARTGRRPLPPGEQGFISIDIISIVVISIAVEMALTSGTLFNIR